MALTYNGRAAEIMLHLVTHSAHGYSQPARAGDGTIETLKLSDGTVTTVHGGDYDCSEAVRMCYVAAGVLPRGCYMWTGNEAGLLKAHGFASVGLGDLRVGDVLLRNGHTEMVVSVGGRLMQAGFRISEHGTISGAKGDQTGWESAYSALNPSAWSWAYRYVGGQPTGASKATVRPGGHLPVRGRCAQRPLGRWHGLRKGRAVQARRDGRARRQRHGRGRVRVGPLHRRNERREEVHRSPHDGRHRVPAEDLLEKPSTFRGHFLLYLAPVHPRRLSTMLNWGLFVIRQASRPTPQESSPRRAGACGVYWVAALGASRHGCHAPKPHSRRDDGCRAF